MTEAFSTLRLVLGDQLNQNHSWYKQKNKEVLYVLMECKSESAHVQHHIQKVIGFFAAMRRFAKWLHAQGHKVHYISINDENNLQSIAANVEHLVNEHQVLYFEYQLPDEYRLDEVLKKTSATLPCRTHVCDTEHFYTERQELHQFFGDKNYLMESFYRHMRRKHAVLMNGAAPEGGVWNFDKDNRNKLPKQLPLPEIKVYAHNVNSIAKEIVAAGLKTIGRVDAGNFKWPISREEALQWLDFFCDELLPLFGTYQDAMSTEHWALFHSRLSFALNIKLLSSKEVVEKVIATWRRNSNTIAYNQVEGFVRQIIGWREYMRGVYWAKMPSYENLNFFKHTNPLPTWFWTGDTKMNCLKHCIKQSLAEAYAHHIQRLMVTGNFALLAGCDPKEVDNWYLGIYIDALQWVEITNTRGMSQYADGGIVGSKPYISSAAYIKKMSNYCVSCHYNADKKTGEGSCPFNSLYWNFFDTHFEVLSKNPRTAMMTQVWQKMKAEEKANLLEQAGMYLSNLNNL